MKNKFSVGKAVRMLTAAVDTFVIPVLLTAAVLPVFHRTNRHRAAPLLFLLFVLLLFAVRYIHKHIIQKRQMLNDRENIILDRIILAEDEELQRVMGEGFILIRKSEPDLFELSAAIKGNAKSVGLLKCDEQTVGFLKRNAPETVIYTRKDLLERFDRNVRKAYGRAFVITETIVSVNRYFLLGVIFLCSSFWLGPKIYYRTISGICLLFALFTGFFDKHIGRKKL